MKFVIAIGAVYNGTKPGARSLVIAVGNIVEADQVNSIVATGRADLVALGRPHLPDPVWTLRASAAAGDLTQFVPPPYILRQDQARRLANKAADTR